MRIYTERVEVVKDLDRQKDELLGIVAHQLAKPITAIRWDLESLLDGDMGALNAEQKTEAQMMKNQAVGLADLVSMILDVSRIQLGRIQFEPKPLDLNELFKEMLDVIKPTIADKKIDFIKKMPANLPTVLLDKRYTRMTIENLLTNAVKYTPEGGKVTLDVKIENGVMHCKVSDTGCGIPKADQGKIFGKMYRASNVVNTVDGNGFGLYVAKGAVEGQGGKIGFESIEGKGTTFFFTLPMKEAPTFSDTKK
ncbi:MAG: HAMP domain-containing histidine kinase [Candidatus Peribacteraceae bacterium]|nr:HAMP domain-containing histidine kinase [Candidatus Peribacteraceae bacterium]